MSGGAFVDLWPAPLRILLPGMPKAALVHGPGGCPFSAGVSFLSVKSPAAYRGAFIFCGLIPARNRGAFTTLAVQAIPDNQQK
jgi:hypothetical protein